VNPDLDLLQPYPFQRLSSLFAGVTPNASLRPISLGIGEPKHPTPQRVKDALIANLDGLASYPATAGSEALRRAMADWIVRRHALPGLDWKREVLPVNGSREALFAFAQTIVDRTRPDPIVVSPNPFYQIYEGATLLAGARAAFLNQTLDNGFRLDLTQLSDEVWRNTQLVFVCSPGNPAGAVLTLDDWRQLFELSDRYGFVIASDECYSEIYFDDAAPPLGGLAVTGLHAQPCQQHLAPILPHQRDRQQTGIAARQAHARRRRRVPGLGQQPAGRGRPCQPEMPMAKGAP
jgi:N-succinyldiaminopimelate aminotransferase